MAICDSDYFHAEMMCEAVTQLEDMLERAELMNGLAQTALDDLQAAAEAYMSSLSDVTYDADTSLVDKTFSPPSSPSVPTAYTVPDATTRLITDTDFDDIYARANARLAREATKVEQEAYDEMAEMGIGLASGPLLSRLAAATQKRAELVSEAAISRAVSEAEMLRDDVKTLHGLHIDAYNGATSRFGELRGIFEAEIRSEGERRGWSQMEISDILEKADKSAGYALDIAKNVNEVLVSTQNNIAGYLIGLAQSLFANANISVSGSGSASVTTSVQE